MAIFTVPPQVLVRAPSQMDNETFRLHMNHRHADSLSDEGEIAEQNFTIDVAEPYRAFHRQLHRTRVDLGHEHSPEPLSAAVEFTLQCLMDNRVFGWRTIAGTPKGSVVSAFPNGTFGIRDTETGRISYYDNKHKTAKALLKGSAK